MLDRNPRLSRAAAEMTRKSTAQNPHIEDTWLIRSRVLLDMGETREAQDCLREAIARLPGRMALHVALARALQSDDRFEEALAETREALRLVPEDKDAKILCFELLVLTKNRDEAESIADDIAALSPANVRLMELWERLRSPQDLLALCNVQLAENPAHTDAHYYKALALAKLGRAAEACEVISLDRLVHISDLPAPPGHADAQSFRAALADEIRRNPTLKPDPRGKATRDGLQTRQLRQPDGAAVEALLAEIKRAVDAYESRLEGSLQGFAIGRPRRAQLTAWAVVYSKDGRQKPHRHPGGWLSGVFYVAAARPDGSNAYRGPLIVGALDPAQHGVEPPWGTLEVEPVPGRLVMFPSYVPHATEATGIEGTRISVAFDVVPADESTASVSPVNN
jgi:tetratricopeptide (TPR) repeat protein